MKFGPILIFQNLFAFEIGRHITLMLFEKNRMTVCTEDGSTNAVLQILYGPYLILGVFGSYMF
jgi:hypothetical protein